jgi:hypothetical protein
VGGRSSRATLGKNPYIWLAKKLLAIESFGGRWTLDKAWRKIWVSHGIDPLTGKVGDERVFETAVRELVRRKERLEALKAERRQERNGVTSSGDAPKGSRTNWEPTPKPLTLAGTEERELLRAINRKLGPKKARLPDPKSFYWPGQPAPTPIPPRSPEESLGSLSCQQEPAKVSRYTNT